MGFDPAWRKLSGALAFVLMPGFETILIVFGAAVMLSLLVYRFAVAATVGAMPEGANLAGSIVWALGTLVVQGLTLGSLIRLLAMRMGGEISDAAYYQVEEELDLHMLALMPVVR